jgi:hypothetical protein
MVYLRLVWWLEMKEVPYVQQQGSDFLAVCFFVWLSTNSQWRFSLFASQFASIFKVRSERSPT